MLLALDGLLKEQLIDWLTVSTYQAISGAGANAIQELFAQYNQLAPLFSDLASPHLDSLRLEQNSQHLLKQAHCPTRHIGALLATNVLPWIDEEQESGQTKEEWKGMSESNKILGYTSPIPIDSTCVRVSTLRSHCQTITMQLNQDLNLADIKTKLKQANPWVQVIPNEKEATLKYLTPVATANSLNIHVGRLRRMHQGPRCVQLFTVGDQLLWGAAEPLKRMLQLIIKFKDNQ